MIRSSLAAAFGLFALTAVQATPVVNSATGHQYDIVLSNGISWSDANSAVPAGWHLATVTSAEEQAFITGVVGNVTELWLGGYQDPVDAGAANNWHWITGEAWSYTNWASGEPNDYNGTSENFLGIWGSGGNWKWNDEAYLGNINGYILEHSPASVPEPGALVLMGLGLVCLGFAYRRKAK